jgi:spore maturation protein CgeB
MDEDRKIAKLDQARRQGHGRSRKDPERVLHEPAHMGREARRAAPSERRLRIVILGLSLTSSWGNGHATTYRALVRELCRRGHDVLFLERNVPWYADNRDLPRPDYGRVALYDDLDELTQRFAAEVRAADFVMVGSYVPEGIAVGTWVQRVARGATAFYDIDTPVTLARLGSGDVDYLSPALIKRYNVYFSFTGGPVLRVLTQQYGARCALPLYCSVDPGLYHPEPSEVRWDLGYMGTYSADRQPALERLLLQPAQRLPAARFAVVGPQYPKDIDWPARVERIEHLAPAQHRSFYNAQRFTLNITRADMIAAGYSPSVRLFEAAACGTPIISDVWDGLSTFFTPGEEILLAKNADDVVGYLETLSPEQARELGLRAQRRVLSEHTAAHRALELETCVLGLLGGTRIAHGESA